MELNNESKTLFIPLLGKAIMSKDNIFLHDPKAEEIIEKGGDNKIAYCMINEKALKNHSLIYDIASIDLQTYEYNDVLSGLNFD